MLNYPACVEPPTVVARHGAPKLSGVEGFSFPVYCVVKSRKGKRENMFSRLGNHEEIKEVDLDVQ